MANVNKRDNLFLSLSLKLLIIPIYVAVDCSLTLKDQMRSPDARDKTSFQHLLLSVMIKIVRNRYENLSAILIFFRAEIDFDRLEVASYDLHRLQRLRQLSLL